MSGRPAKRGAEGGNWPRGKLIRAEQMGGPTKGDRRSEGSHNGLFVKHVGQKLVNCVPLPSHKHVHFLSFSASNLSQ